MKTRISRFVIAAAIAALFVLGGNTVAWADCPASPNYVSNFNSDQSCLTLNGVAAFVAPIEGPTVLRLTPNDYYKSGSAWFSTQQPVSGAFSTTFKFQLTGCCDTEGTIPADGIAFVIQNSGAGTGALDTGGDFLDGCSIGFGQSSDGVCTPASGGIMHSVAIEFDTYKNAMDVSNNHVAIQNCGGTGANSVDPSCSIADKDLTGLPITMADGNIHTATITYKLSGCGEGGTQPCLDVILDNTDLFPGGVAFDLTSIGLTGGNAWVGFTGATGGSFENNDILSWTFTPGAQSAAITAGGGAAVLSFNGGTGNNAYDYNAQLLSGGVTSATVNIQPILIDEEACEQLVDANPKFGLAQCFVYQNAGKDGSGNTVDSPVMFELTCPGSSTGGTCGSPANPNFPATLGTDFTFLKAENEGFQLLNSTIGPYPGWLKGVGPDPLHPCTPFPGNIPPLFQSNQITSFSVVGDPRGTTSGGSGGNGSCWLGTYATGGELPPGIKITSPTIKTYARSLIPGVASYTCSNPKTSQNLSTSAVGPYLTVASCTQSQQPNPNNLGQNPGCALGSACTGGFDLSVKGLHTFQVRSTDSGGNVNVNVVVYNVK